MKTKAWKIKNNQPNSRSVWECGSPRPLLTGRGDSTVPPSARGLAHSKTWRFPLLYFCFLFSVFSFRASGQSFSLDWYKISGGGGPLSGGNYSLSGTIGQPDASGAMHGGNYSVTGGFWSLYAVQTPGAPLLTITYAGNQAIVSWDPSVTSWTLQTNANLAMPAWGNYLGFVVNNSVTNAPPLMNVFFRLKQ